MSVITFDVAVFRAEFPQFAPNPPTDATLQGYFDAATNYVDNRDYGCLALTGAARVLALNLMTAHIGALFAMIAADDTPAFETSATIDKVSVTVEAPPNKTQFGWWLSLTSYGQQLQALLGVAGVGGGYVGGGGGRARAFRGPAGGF